MSEKREALNVYQYASKVLGYEINAFLEGDGYEEEWDLLIDVLYHEKRKV